ncbi:MAG TPA: hypothetical protein VFZ83_07880 [Acidimicrobiia bacterium]|nr:hypothetical protein [Acidimicrobiia bacterium]
MSRIRSSRVAVGVVPLVVVLLATALAVPAAAAHGAPVITSPIDGATVCVPAGATTASIPVVGTTIANAPVSIRAGGTPVANGAADGAGAFSVPTVLGAGAHVLDAIATDAADPAHDSDPSAPVDLTVVDPNGALGAVGRTASVISPRNGDGYLDGVTFSVLVSKPGSVHFEVRSGGTLVRSSTTSATGAGATRTWLWKGKSAANDWVASGTYTVFAIWEQGGCASSTSTSIKVDNFGPTVSAIAVSASKFYPAENDDLVEYQDTVTVKYGTLNETAHVSLYVFRRGGTTPVRKISLGWKSAGTNGSYVWNGRNATGTMLPEGSYDLAWRLLDGPRNERIGARKVVTISHWRVATRTTTVRANGNAFLQFAESGCGDVATSLSDWGEGVWISTQDCFWDDQLLDGALVEYNFGVPAAVAYGAARVDVYGYSVFATPLYGAVENNSGSISVIGSVLSASPATRSFPGFSLANRVTSQRRVIISLSTFSLCDCELFTDYDIRYVDLALTYGVLAPQ